MIKQSIKHRFKPSGQTIRTSLQVTRNMSAKKRRREHFYVIFKISQNHFTSVRRRSDRNCYAMFLTEISDKAIQNLKIGLTPFYKCIYLIKRLLSVEGTALATYWSR